MSTKASDGMGAKLFALLGSMKLATWLFILLGILTFAGTLEQANMSLYDVQIKYFESIVLVWWIGGSVPVPLLGGYLLLSVLFINLFVGGIIRIRKSWKVIGVMIAHVGILCLLASTFVEYFTSSKGQMTLFVNETAGEFQSVHEWEVLVAAPSGDGQREFVIPWESFKDLDSGESVRWTHADLPFDVVISDVARNAQPQPARPGDTHAIEGFVLARLKPVGMGNRVNVPGVIATLHPKQEGGKAMRSILWGLQEYPWDPEVDGTRYFVDLRRRTWDMPFSVRLDRFEHEKYAGTMMAKRYSSYVTKIDGATQEPIHITMNEPLRWRGYTLYQSDYGPKPNDPPGTPEYSTLSVVKNPADRWPEYMTWLIFAGMLIHFSIKLYFWILAELSRAQRRRAAAAMTMLFALVLGGCGDYTVGKHSGWSADVQESIGHVPVQADGRVKPLHTWAAFGLLGMNHKRTCLDTNDEKLKPVEWFLDTAFRPERARTHRCFSIKTRDTLKAVGAKTDGKKMADRYGYDEFMTDDVRARLAQLGEQYRQIEPKERSPVQAGVVELENSVALYEGIEKMFEWARTDFAIEESLRPLFNGKAEVRFSEVIERSPQLVARARAGMGKKDDGSDSSPEALAISSLLGATFSKVERGLRIGLFPPTGQAKGDEVTWLMFRDVAGFALLRGVVEDEHLEALRAMESMARAAGDAEAFAEGASAWRAATSRLAERRGEYKEVEREMAFYSQAPFDGAMGMYGLAVLLAIVMLFVPRWRWMSWVVGATTVVALGYHVYGIVLRCLIRGRPPVSTLYETIIFICATGVVALLAVELFTRRRIALALAPVLGLGLLLLAGRYEILTGTDTMPQLVAVLDTNYWLTLHVLCISLGYMGGLVAALIAHVYVFAKLFRGNNIAAEWYRAIAKMTYAMLCFALLTSLVGTILGGIWANDSWGRFWGWDPKENGALLIVLAQLAILHARMAGMIKALGIALATIFQGMIVAFSWWGVNLLGIGLHSYGFTSGIANALTVFYCIEGAVLLLGAYVYLRDRLPTPSTTPPPLDGSISS